MIQENNNFKIINDFFDEAPVGIYRADLNGKIVLANKKFLEILNCTSIEQLSNIKLFKENDFDIFVNLLKEKGELRNFKSLILNKNGQEINVWQTAKMDSSDDKYFNSIINIFSVNQEEKNLPDLQLLNALMDSSPDHIFFKNRQSRFIKTSKSHKKILGINENEDVLGKTDFDFFPPEAAQSFFDEEQALMEKDEPMIASEKEIPSSDGGTIWVSRTKIPLKDNKGNVIGLVGISRNITENKKSEALLRQMQKLEGLGNLAGGIAHDFNNILGIILAYVTSLSRFKNDPVKADRAIDIITKAVQRGTTLVKQILTFARKTDTEFTAVDINNIVTEIVMMISEMFPRVINIRKKLGQEIPAINGDRSQIHQALLNLCVNARDAMPNGGNLTISTYLVAREKLPRHDDNIDNTSTHFVCLEVTDTGDGMSEEIKQKIFEPFFTTKPQGKGTGLGLSVVFGVVKAHKGFMCVDSELGKGASFKMYIPVINITKENQSNNDIANIEGGQETILIAEDELTLLYAIQTLLEDKGYKTLTASDGKEAVDIYLAQKDKINLVFTDLGMPKMSGMEEIELIKKANPNVKIVVATGYLDTQMRDDFLKIGVKGFINKPYETKEILKTIRDVLDENKKS